MQRAQLAPHQSQDEEHTARSAETLSDGNPVDDPDTELEAVAQGHHAQTKPPTLGEAIPAQIVPHSSSLPQLEHVANPAL
eukprot:3061681-Amphidinium_carterae.1